MKKNRRVLITTLVVSIVMLIVLASLFLFNYGISSRLENSTLETLDEISLQQQFTISAELNNERSALESMAEALAIIGNDQAKILDYLHSVVNHYGFANLIVVDVRGVGIVASGEIVDVSNKSYFDVARQGNFIMSEPDLSVVTNDTVLTSSLPIYVDGNVSGVLIAEYTVEFLREFLSKSFGGQSYSAVVNQDGIVMLESSDLYGVNSNMYNIFNSSNILGSRTSDEVLRDIYLGVQGSIEYTFNGLTKLADYRPVGFNDWSIVTIIPTNLIDDEVNGIFFSMIIVASVIFLCFIVFTVYIMLIERRNLKTVEKVAYYDELTGLYNLNKLRIEAKRILEDNPKTEFVIIKYDFVNFKSINELFSFEMGNKILKLVKTVSDTVQDETYMHARVGTDEFMFFGKLSLFENFEVGRFEFESMYKSLLEGMEHHHLEFRYGRYIIPKGETNIIEIINRVNLAHTSTKKEGASLFCDYDENFKNQILTATEITNKMEDALSNNEFKLFLQPKNDLESGEVVGAEALVRWVESDGNMVFPGEFIPLFESNGFIVEVDKYMLSQACSVLASWRDRGKKCFPISVNFSRLHIANPEFVNEVIQTADSYGIDHELIEIELTETILVDNEYDLDPVIKSFRKNGFSVAIDDFGSGLSSLGMLKNFNVNTLKIDRSFFVNSNDEERSSKVIKSIINLSNELDMHTVAEGIELQEQIDFLKDIGCNMVQGYYYSKPLPVKDFEDFIGY